MKKDDLAAAVAEARRFIERAQALQSVYAKTGRDDNYPLPERSAARRSSLDLTRALAKLRRS